jgi:hypothetical protein
MNVWLCHVQQQLSWTRHEPASHSLPLMLMLQRSAGHACRVPSGALPKVLQSAQQATAGTHPA